MWVYFYVSKERIRQLALQVDPSTLSEYVKKWDAKGTAKGNLESESSKLLEFIGLKGKISGGGETSLTRQSERKFSPSDEVNLESVRKHLEKKTTFVDVSKLESLGMLDSKVKLIKFKGLFHPIISGNNAAERIANYEDTEYIFWNGKCGTINITIVTSKHSLVSHTPVIQSIVNEGQSLEIEGFGTIAANIQGDTLPILPLFFGLQIGVK